MPVWHELVTWRLAESQIVVLGEVRFDGADGVRRLPAVFQDVAFRVENDLQLRLVVTPQ